jgi:hypothetical protein
MIAHGLRILGALWRAVCAVFERLSDPVHALLCIGALLLGVALGMRYQLQQNERAATLAAAEQAQADAAATRADAQTADRVVTRYVGRVRTVREAAAVITKEVPVYVPSDACTLPAGFRVLHDAAAAGLVPDAARLADAAPADAQTVAATVADNYAACHAIREQLTALQQFERERGHIGTGAVGGK